MKNKLFKDVSGLQCYYDNSINQVYHGFIIVYMASHSVNCILSNKCFLNNPL